MEHGDPREFADELAPADQRVPDTGLEQRLCQIKQTEVQLLVQRDAAGRKSGQALWYCKSVTEVFWRSVRDLYKVREAEVQDGIKVSHQQIWPFMAAPPLSKQHSTASGTRVLASTMPTTSVFALAHHIFTSNRRKVEDRRAAEFFLRFWVNKMAGEEIIVMQFTADGESYRYHRTVIDRDGCVADIWTPDYRDAVAAEPSPLFALNCRASCVGGIAY